MRLSALSVLALWSLPALATGHLGNPTVTTDVRDRTGWTVTASGEHDIAVDVKDCSTGTWSAAIEVVDTNSEPIGWKFPIGTWCAAGISWTGDLDLDATGPGNRTIDATVDMGTFDVDFTSNLTIGSSNQDDDLFHLELGEGDWLSLAESMMAEDATATISPGSSSHDTLRAELRGALLVQDADTNGVVTNTERSNNAIGTHED